MVIADRLFSGEATEQDLEWIDTLYKMFRGVSIKDLSKVGMRSADVRLFTGMLSMQYRLNEDHKEKASEIDLESLLS